MTYVPETDTRFWYQKTDTFYLLSESGTRKNWYQIARHTYQILVSVFWYQNLVSVSGTYVMGISRFCMHNVIRQTIPHIDNSVSKKNLRRSYLARFFCSFKSLPLVVSN